jgi:hypothetical protein
MRYLPILLFAVVAILFLLPTIFADAVAPQVFLSISYNTSSNASVVSGLLYQCDDIGCSPTTEDALNISCESDGYHCESSFYHRTGDYRLALQFSDGTTKESGAFSVAYPAIYDVLVNDDGLSVAWRHAGQNVINEPDGMNVLMIAFYIILAMLITIVSELLIAGAYIYLTKKPWWIMLAVVAANIISLPLVWIVSIILADQWPAVIIAMEVFAIAFEAFFIHLLNKKGMPLKDAFVLSAAMNLGSIIVGWLVLNVML